MELLLPGLPSNYSGKPLRILGHYPAEQYQPAHAVSIFPITVHRMTYMIPHLF